MKKSAITLGLILGGLTAGAGAGADNESAMTNVVNGHAPTINAPSLVNNALTWDSNEVILELNEAPKDAASDEDGDDLTQLDIWVTPKNSNERLFELHDQPLESVTQVALNNIDMETIKNKELKLYWKVKSDYGFPVDTKESQPVSTDFSIIADLTVTITQSVSVNDVITITATDGGNFTLAESNLELSLEGTQGDGMYDKALAQQKLDAATRTPVDSTTLTITAPKEIQGYKVVATVTKDSISSVRSKLR
ncbi:hypothetical protein [Vibrio sagamiensis]|uniref:WxL domain-containing protein n=1 Tax=Vibrio sagamiensis NBRC 104589 TaxID=1219064 RepID=A0A511QIM7_9VIBR|nr:hypothetical protein [Vibrio sagamiensis]PNQ57683.1 hypothetical protein C1141_13495 [Vibrio agarivorans]GEM76322.1 hypothetical protein VSA01S_24340 [Vibrio sagamiensis NBRC 104589]